MGPLKGLLVFAGKAKPKKESLLQYGVHGSTFRAHGGGGRRESAKKN